MEKKSKATREFCEILVLQQAETRLTRLPPWRITEGDHRSGARKVLSAGPGAVSLPIRNQWIKTSVKKGIHRKKEWNWGKGEGIFKGDLDGSSKKGSQETA